MKNNRWEQGKTVIRNIPFWIMLVFTMIHLSVYIKFQLNGRQFSLSVVNQLGSMLYVGVIYLWAFFVNRKTSIRMLAVIMGVLSACGFFISLPNMGNSLNDLLFTGTAVLTVLYVFENAEYLLQLVKKSDKILTAAIWSFVVFSVFLFIFFPEQQHQWGKGFYLYGHRYASVCSLAIMLTGLKLANKPRYAGIYWVLLLLFFYLCFWTGARVYVLSNLGQVYAFLFVFRRNNKDFIFKCIAITLAALLAFFTSSAGTKVENIVEITNQELAQQAAGNVSVDETHLWVNNISNGRLEIWKNCIRSYQKLPVFNKMVGSGNKYLYDHNVLPNGSKILAHTDFLNILHFNGLIGLIIYLVVFIGYVFFYWRARKLHIIILIGFWGVWFVLALLNGYGNYTADMMSLPYMSVLALWDKSIHVKEEL